MHITPHFEYGSISSSYRFSPTNPQSHAAVMHKRASGVGDANGDDTQGREGLGTGDVDSVICMRCSVNE